MMWRMALKREWKEDCKPARVLRHVQQFHVEMPTRVTAAHVAAFEAWLEFEQDETKHVYDTFAWPVPKGCPGIVCWPSPQHPDRWGVLFSATDGRCAALFVSAAIARVQRRQFASDMTPQRAVLL